MKQYGYENSARDLDAIFAALANPTRRAILLRLTKGEAAVSELAEPFAMSQPAVSKHLKILERAGLVERGVDEQRRPSRLKAEKMGAAVEWLTEFREFWDKNFNQLDEVLADLNRTQTKEKKP